MLLPFAPVLFGPTSRVRLAFKLFDSEGMALVKLLRDGSGALEEMCERARHLGSAR